MTTLQAEPVLVVEVVRRRATAAAAVVFRVAVSAVAGPGLRTAGWKAAPAMQEPYLERAQGVKAMATVDQATGVQVSAHPKTRVEAGVVLRSAPWGVYLTMDLARTPTIPPATCHRQHESNQHPRGLPLAWEGCHHRTLLEPGSLIPRVACVAGVRPSKLAQGT